MSQPGRGWRRRQVGPTRPERSSARVRIAGDVLVAEYDRVVGYVRLRHPGPLRANRHVLQINGVAVDPAYRRRGIARALLDAAIDEARSRGARRLTLRVFAPNAAARALYDAAGFEVEGVLRGEFFLDGGYVDDVLMALDLTSA